MKLNHRTGMFLDKGHVVHSREAYAVQQIAPGCYWARWARAAGQEELLHGKADFIILAKSYGKKQARIEVGHRGLSRTEPRGTNELYE